MNGCTPISITSSLLSGHDWQENVTKTETGTATRLYDSALESKLEATCASLTAMDIIPTSKCLERSPTCSNIALRTAISSTMDRFLKRQTSTTNSLLQPRVVTGMPLTDCLWRISFLTCGENTYGDDTLLPPEQYWNMALALSACNCRDCLCLTSQLSLLDPAVAEKLHGRYESAQSLPYYAPTWMTSNVSVPSISPSSLTTWTSNICPGQRKST